MGNLFDIIFWLIILAVLYTQISKVIKGAELKYQREQSEEGPPEGLWRPQVNRKTAVLKTVKPKEKKAEAVQEKEIVIPKEKVAPEKKEEAPLAFLDKITVEGWQKAVILSVILGPPRAKEQAEYRFN